MLKIRQQTPTQLILRHRPIALWVMGSFFTIVGVVIIILFSKASSFTCERVPPNQGRCELIYSHFLMSKSIIISINDLKGTEVVTTRARQMDNFFTPYGTSSREEQEALAAKINAFLKKTPETSLLIKRDNRWFIYILGSILIVVGLLAELSKIITVTFDKMVGSLKIERQGLLGTEVIEHPLEEISEVKLNTSSYFNSKTILYQVVTADS